MQKLYQTYTPKNSANHFRHSKFIIAIYGKDTKNKSIQHRELPLNNARR